MVQLNKAYKIIFGEDPMDLEEWQIAEKLMDNFNVPKLGEELAKEVIYSVVLYVKYPSQEITRRVVLKGEEFAGELWDDLPDEVHMADLERKLFLETNKKLESKNESSSRK